MKYRVWLASLLFYSALGIWHSAFAEVPPFINYQGRLLNGAGLVNGSVELSLRLFNAPAGGSSLYEDSNTVTVTDGLYATSIGDDPVAPEFLAALTNPTLFVEVAVDGITLAPRERVASVAYALSLRGLRATTNSSFVFNPDVNALAASASNTTVGGGEGHVVRADASHVVVAGGFEHLIGTNAAYAAIGGGYDNRILEEARYSVIAGGIENLIERDSSVAAIAGGVQNTIGTNSGYSFIGGGTVNAVVGASEGVVGGGSFNLVRGAATAVVGGGAENRILAGASYSFLGGGAQNTISNASQRAVLAGGSNNRVDTNSSYAFLGGGQNNVIGPSAPFGSIVGGADHLIGAGADRSSIGGGFHNRVGEKSDASVIAGGLEHEVGTNSVWTTIGGGFSNVVAANSAAPTISGGRNNRIGQDAEYATVGGGIANRIEDLHFFALIAGGTGHLIASNGRAGVIGGGQFNAIQTFVTNGTIAGGSDHIIATGAHHAVIGGGLSNRVTGRYGTIPGGDQNLATNYAFAAGQRAKARHDGAFVWGDNSGADVASTNANSATLRAAGGYRLFSNAGLTLGAQLPPNGTAWAAISDRNAKENFAPIDTAAILDRVAQLPLTAWTYKQDPDHRRYIGPVAQDFHAAFGLGNDTTISTLDADGVALAAIQALAEEDARLRQEASAWQGRQTIEDRGRQEQIDGLRSENAELKRQLNEVLQRLRTLEQR